MRIVRAAQKNIVARIAKYWLRFYEFIARFFCIARCSCAFNLWELTAH
ncbi:MAG: hypothetical protein ABSH33_20580 [Steroidobacteraceae bacterium]